MLQPMTQSDSHPDPLPAETVLTNEVARIQGVYAARERDIPWSRYSVASPGALLLQQQRVRSVVRVLRDGGYFPLSETRIGDVGCGHGGWLVDFESWGATQSRLAGIDLDPARVDVTRKRLPEADIRLGDGLTLPWPDGSFDLVVQGTMFSSILDQEMRTVVAAEMARVLAPGGAILWYDFFLDNPGNPDVRGIRRNEIRRLFPGFDGSLRRATLAPPISRRLARFAWPLAVALESGRLLNTHYVGLLRRRS